MLSFLTKFATVVRGVLQGFDRLFFCGTLRPVAHTRGLQHYLWAHRIPYKDFAAHSLEVTARLEEASLRQAQQLGREIRYLNSAQHRKEDIARDIAARDRIIKDPVSDHFSVAVWRPKDDLTPGFLKFPPWAEDLTGLKETNGREQAGGLPTAPPGTPIFPKAAKTEPTVLQHAVQITWNCCPGKEAPVKISEDYQYLYVGPHWR